MSGVVQSLGRHVANQRHWGGGSEPSLAGPPWQGAGSGDGQRAPNPGEERRGQSTAGSIVVETILRANRAMALMADMSLHQVTDDVTIPQYRTLVLLAAGGPSRLAPLAHAMGVNSSTATRMCDRLVRKGLITRERDEGDRREIVLDLTAQGRDLVQKVTVRRKEMVEDLLHDIPSPERPALVRSLGLLTRVVNQLSAEHWRAGWAPD